MLLVSWRGSSACTSTHSLKRRSGGHQLTFQVPWQAAWQHSFDLFVQERTAAWLCNPGLRQTWPGAGSALLTCWTPPPCCREVSALFWTELLEGTQLSTVCLLIGKICLLPPGQAAYPCITLQEKRACIWALPFPHQPRTSSYSKVTSSKVDFQHRFFHGEEIFDVSRGAVFVFWNRSTAYLLHILLQTNSAPSMSVHLHPCLQPKDIQSNKRKCTRLSWYFRSLFSVMCDLKQWPILHTSLNIECSFPTDQRNTSWFFFFFPPGKVTNSSFLAGGKQFWSCRRILAPLACPEIPGESNTEERDCPEDSF